jgi:hypothetical protein
VTCWKNVPGIGVVAPPPADCSSLPCDATPEREIDHADVVVDRPHRIVRPRQIMSAALAPHCWKATSFADPEYVIGFGIAQGLLRGGHHGLRVLSPSRSPDRHARQSGHDASLFTTAPPPFVASRATPPSWSRGACTARALAGMLYNERP